MMNKVINIVLISAGLVALTACSVPKEPNNVPVTSARSGDNAAKTYTYATQTDDGYRGGRGQSGFYQNSMTAPSNQTYYFSFDSSKMRSQDGRALMVQANFLASHPNAKIRLEGNTDNRGSREYNIGLGWRRDQSIARMLEQQGVRPDQIQMVSYGKERPAVTGNNEHVWSLNRRVKLIYKVS